MDEQDLQINITAVDEASGTLQEIAAEAEGLATSVNEAAASIEGALTNSLTVAEEAAVESALATANAWMGAEEDIAGTAASMAETVTEEFDTIAMASRAAALSTVPTWEESLSEIATLGEMTSTEVDAAFAKMSEGAKKGAADTESTMTSMHGYFRMLIAGYLADTAGKSMIDAVLGTVTAAVGNPEQLAQLQTQLATAQAELQKLSLPISGKGKTTDELQADQAEQTARIAATQLQIQQLKAQLEPLALAQERAGQAANDFDAATKQLNEDWQRFLITSGAPLLELLTHLAQMLDTVINRVTAFAAAHPKLAEAILITIGVLGGLLLVLGSLLIAVAPVIILFGMFGATITAASLTAAAASAAMVAAVVFAVATIIANWNNVARTTTAVWDGIVTSLSSHWETIKTDVQAAWTWIYDFIEGIWAKIVSGAQSAIGTVQDLITSIMAPINKLTATVSSIAGSIGNAAGGFFNAIPHFAEGGIVSSPTIGLIGEAGPEAIIPLSAFSGGQALAGGSTGGGAGNIVVSLSGNFYGSDEQMMRKLSQSLGQMINRQIKLRSI